MALQTEYKTLPDNGTSPQKVLELHQLNVCFGRKCVLSNISFSLMEGENLVVLGQPGSGKSVLVKCLAGLQIPNSGEIFIFGRERSSVNKNEREDLKKRMSVFFQGGALYEFMNVKENLDFPLKRQKLRISESERHEKIIELLQFVGSRETLYKMPSQLSTAMKKRIALARTLITVPEIVLYDEPTQDLDPVSSGDFSELVTRARKKFKCTSLITTQDLIFAREVADRVLLLRDGEIFAEGSFEELEQSRHPWIRKFFGKK